MTDRNRLGWLASGSALATLAALSALGASGAALAAEGGDKATQVDEVIVTANKRSEKVLDVAGAVTAVRGSDLMKRNVLQVQDLATQVPGFSVQTFGARATKLILRGLNAGGNGATVATVLDEAPLSYASATSNGAIDIANFDTFDLDRIEVLRGPQGTLYGAAAEGGLIKYVTNAPKLDRVEAAGEAEIEQVDSGGVGYTVRGYTNLPLATDKVALRFGGFYKQIEGYVDNPLLKNKDANEGNRYGGRAQLLLQPTDNVSIRLGALVQKQHFDDNGYTRVYGNRFGVSPEPRNRYDLYQGKFTKPTAVQDWSDNNTELYTAVVKFEGKDFDFLSSTSYGKVESHFATNINDFDAAPGFSYYEFLRLLVYGKYVNGLGDQINNLQKFNQEFRISSKPDSVVFGMPTDWVAGVYFAHEDIRFDQIYNARDVNTNAIITVPIPLGGSTLPATYDEGAVFANATVHFTPQFNLSFGGRYADSWQWSQVTNRPGLVTGVPTVLVNPAIEPPHEKVFTWSVAPQYKINDDVQVYGKVATGFRPGGPELLIPGAPKDFPQSYSSDSTTNYEIGLKGQFFDRRLTLDLAAYRIDWKDAQVIVQYISQTSGQTYNVIGNANDARSQGFEWNITFRPLAGLELGFLGSKVDAKLTQDAPALPGGGGKAGDLLPNVPKLTYTLNADYRWNLGGDVDAFAGASWSHNADVEQTIVSQSKLPTTQPLPSYNKLDAHLGVNRGKLTAQIYAINLTNEYALLSYSNSGGQNSTGLGTPLQPRTIGFRIGYRY